MSQPHTFSVTPCDSGHGGPGVLPAKSNVDIGGDIKIIPIAQMAPLLACRRPWGGLVSCCKWISSFSTLKEGDSCHEGRGTANNSRESGVRRPPPLGWLAPEEGSHLVWCGNVVIPRSSGGSIGPGGEKRGQMENQAEAKLLAALPLAPSRVPSPPRPGHAPWPCPGVQVLSSDLA